MSDSPFLWDPSMPRRVVAWAFIGLSLRAAPPQRPAQASAQIPGRALTRTAEALDARVAVLVAGDTGLGHEAARLRIARLEEAWKRAGAQGLLTTSAWEEFRQEGQREILVKAYLDSRPGHPGMTEDQVLAAFLAQGEQRRVSHVLCKTSEEAEAAMKRIQGGEAIDAVAAERSVDPSAAVNRGELGWIRQREMVAAFGDPVFAAPIGELVGPLKSEFGWHVAKVWESRRPKADDFPAQRQALMKQAAKAESAMKREKALESLRARYPLTPDMEVLGGDRTTEPLPGDEKRVAGRVAGMTISLKALKAHLADVLKTMGQSHSLGAATKGRFMEGLADQIRLVAAARKGGLDRHPKVQAALWVDARNRAHQRYSEAFLAGVKVADGDLQKHHQAFPDRFRQVGALRLQVLVAESKDRVDEALNQVRAGMVWRQAVTQFGNAEATGNPEPGWVEVASLSALVPPTLMQPLLAGPMGQAVGPMLGPDGFMIFNVLERRPGPVMTLDECRDAVRADYLKVHGQALVEASLDAVEPKG